MKVVIEVDSLGYVKNIYSSDPGVEAVVLYWEDLSFEGALPKEIEGLTKQEFRG